MCDKYSEKLIGATLQPVAISDFFNMTKLQSISTIENSYFDQEIAAIFK